MTFQVDQCKNFKDGKVCSKCGRMMPAYCKEQQDLEEKARKYDEWVASQTVHDPSIQQDAAEVSDEPTLADTLSERKDEEGASPEEVKVDDEAKPLAKPKGLRRKARR